MSITSLHYLAAALYALSFPSYGDQTFQEPKSESEWKTFCEAPNLKNRLEKINDKELRQKVASTCARAPWQKFVSSPPRSW